MLRRYVPEIIKKPIRKRRIRKKRNHILNLKDPEILLLETTTRCNANCFYCGRPKENRDMDLELFKALVDMAPDTKEIHPNTRGEPLLYPHIIEAIEYCKSHDKTVATYTNGSLLNRSMAEKLLKSGLDKLTFSIDDCVPERYRRSRGGLDFYNVARNVRRLVTLRDAARFPLRIHIRATLTDINRDHQKQIREYWSFVDSFAFVPQIGVISNIPLFSWTTGQPLFCPDPFRALSVRWNGQPVLCCNDWEDNFPIGTPLTTEVTRADLLNVFEQTKEIGHVMMDGHIPAVCSECRNRRSG